MNVGFAMCGSFCTYASVFPVMELLTRDYRVTPIFSIASNCIDSRFGTAPEHRTLAEEICGTPPLTTIDQNQTLMGTELFLMVKAISENGAIVDKIVLPQKLIVRESC